MSKIQSESNSQQVNTNLYLKYSCGSDVKDTIWKQFTTGSLRLFRPARLWFRCQRYNLKAIHNGLVELKKLTFVVVPMSKIQSESNSQHSPSRVAFWVCCGSDVKDTIWKQFTTPDFIIAESPQLWFRCQRYNLKAIHNGLVEIFNFPVVVVPMSKIQSESNSQQGMQHVFNFLCCGSDVKDTIWKQFTTATAFPPVMAQLWFRCQRYNLKAIHNRVL